MKENGKTSIMRISLLSVIAMAILLVISMSGYMIAALLMSIALDWSGMAVFLGAIGLFITPAFAGKAIQKKFEKQE